MTCTTGDRSCETPRRRGALVVLLLMALLFLALSVFSFVDSRDQVVPDQVTYGEYTADEGKRIFQAYNCMGCHTIVGNGAYLGPDLTKEYAKTGPAWLEAFLPSAGHWPTKAAVMTHLLTPEQLDAAGVATADEYFNKYPGAAERVERRGGSSTHMPNLTFREGEVGKLIAFLKYTSAMNTEGWPPKVKTGTLAERLQLAGEIVAQPVSTVAPAVVQPADAGEGSDMPPTTPQDLAAKGKELVTNYGCVACHAADKTRLVGPGWGGLYGSTVTFADGSTGTADEAYLDASIRTPDSHVVQGFPGGVMPPYGSMLTDDEVAAMVAYLKSLQSPEGH